MGNADVISGLGSRTSIIHATADAERRGLNPEESRLVACVGAGCTLGEALARGGLPEPRAIALLLGLRLRGIINPGPRRGASAIPWKAPPTPAPTAAPAKPAPARPSGPPPAAAPARPTPKPAAAAPAPAPLDEAAMGEGVDLDDARKREILAAESRCGLDHFSVLGLKPGADPADVKKAYYELSRKLHPDRFFGKSLGSFKGRIDKVFKRLTEAQGVLSDPTRRAAYLAANPQLAPAAPARSPLDEARAAERRARLMRHPYLSKHARFHELVAKGRELLARGDFSRAYTDLSLAAQVEPNNRELQALLLQAKRGGDRLRAADEFREGISAETLGDFAQAVAQFRKAVGLDPDNAEFCHRLARQLAHSGGEAELKEAHGHARHATELAPANVEYHLTFASILVRAGLEKNAAREYEAVLKLRPDDAFAKDQLKKLRWGI